MFGPIRCFGEKCGLGLMAVGSLPFVWISGSLCVCLARIALSPGEWKQFGGPLAFFFDQPFSD